MLCEYCNTEHPKDQIANPHYCIARMQESIEALEADLELANGEARLKCKDCNRHEAFEENVKLRERIKAQSDVIIACESAIKRKTGLYEKVTDDFAIEVQQLTTENKQLNDLFTDLDNPDNAQVLWKGKYLIQRVEDHDAELKRFYDLRAENEKLKEVLATRTIVR